MTQTPPIRETEQKESDSSGRKFFRPLLLFLRFFCFLPQNFDLPFCAGYIAALMTFPMVSAASRFISAVAWVPVLRVNPAE